MKFAVVALALMIPVVASLNIQCLFNSGPFGPFMGSNSYFCQVISLNVQTEYQIVDGISGTHAPEKSDSDVKVLWIIHKTCHYLPKNLENYFPNIEVLAVTASGLKALTKEDLKVFEHLKSLYMNANTFTTLNADLFQFSPKLQHIDMANNKIATLPSGIFDSLENLEQVMLDGNICVSQNYYDRESIERLKNDIATNCQKSSQDSCKADSKVLDEIASLKSLMLHQKNDECSERIAKLEAMVSILINDSLSLKKLVSKIPKQVANIMKTLGPPAALSTDLAKQEESDEVEVFSAYPTTPASAMKRFL